MKIKQVFTKNSGQYSIVYGDDTFLKDEDGNKWCREIEHYYFSGTGDKYGIMIQKEDHEEFIPWHDVVRIVYE